MRAIVVRGASPAHTISPTTTHATAANPLAIGHASVSPAAATMSGDGVSPAASAAASGSAPGQRRCDRERRRWTPPRLFRQAAQNHAFDRRVEIAHDGRRRRHRSGLVQLLQIAEGGGVERAAPREDFEEDQSERVDVALNRGRLSSEQFGRHVLRRARHRSGRAAGRRDAEVGDADVALAVDHHVGRLEVAVNHAALVCRRHAGAELPRQI